MADINFDELDNEVRENLENKNSEFNIKMQQTKKKGITEGWTKGPFIVGGIIAAILILISLYIVFIM